MPVAVWLDVVPSLREHAVRLSPPPLLASVDAVGLARFTVSAGLLLFTSMAFARRVGATWADRYWIAIAAAAAQVAVVSLLLSPAHALTPTAFLLAQCALAAIVGWTAGWRDADALPRPRLGPLAATPARKLLLAYVGLFLLIAVATAIVLPVNTFDDRMYRASRAAYWLHHRSLLPWPTHNDRQVAFPFGSEIVFFWPVLMTRSELPGRVAFLAGTLLLVAGAYGVMRHLRATRTAALSGLLLLLSTPAVVYLQEALQPEVWVSVFALGAAHFALRAATDDARRAARHLAWVGFFAALAVNAKTTALAMLPGAVLLAFIVPAATGRRWRAGLACVLGGAVAGAVVSGLGFTLTTNLLRDGHPLGPPAMSAAHTAERSWRSARTHAARFVVELIDLPVVPSMDARRAVTDVGNRMLRLLRADEPLRGEEFEKRWPGPYYVAVGRYASRFSVGGMMWLPALAAAVVLAARKRNRDRRLAVLLALAVPLLAGPVLVVRWMAGMERFLVPAYVLGVPMIVLIVQRLSRRRRWVGVAAVALLMLTALPVLWRRAEQVVGWAALPPSDLVLQEPFRAALRHLPAGSRILLVAAEDARDYPLFLPHAGYANRVISWGDAAFDPARMRRLLDEHRATHVLVQDDVVLRMHWDPPIETGEMVRWLAVQPDLRELPGVSPGQRLFARP